MKGTGIAAFATWGANCVIDKCFGHIGAP